MLNGSSTVGRFAIGAGGDRSLQFSRTARSGRVPCRFHYFGVPDEVDYRNIPRRNARFDEEELNPPRRPWPSTPEEPQPHARSPSSSLSLIVARHVRSPQLGE